MDQVKRIARISVASFGVIVSPFFCLANAAETAATQINVKAIPRPLKTLTINPASTAGGSSPRSEGTVELVQAPGPEGITVKLESSNPQLAIVPDSITITHGAQSSETGPIVKKSFFITTRPVQEKTTVTIKARVGAQSLEAQLRIDPPRVKLASLEAPYICDGNNKATLRYTLSGPATSGLEVWAYFRVERSGEVQKSDAVSTGDIIGSMRIALPRCQLHLPNERCRISGYAKVKGDMGYSAQFGGSCGHPPD